MIEYKITKSFTENEIKELFCSVDWFSGNFPDKISLAFSNSNRVISAWEKEKLIGIIRGLDDGVWQATIDCLLVHSNYQKRGIASTLLKMLLADYKDFLYVDIITDKNNETFYTKHGFKETPEEFRCKLRGNGRVYETKGGCNPI